MTKSTKVKNNESGSDSDEEVDLMDMLEQAHSCLELKRKNAKNYARSLKLSSNPLMNSMLLMRV
jgi:hypothetical protein